MPPRRPLGLSEIACGLIGHVGRTQALLDRAYLEDLAAQTKDLELIGVDTNHPIAKAIRPSSLRIGAQEISARLQLSETRTTRLGLDLKIMGRVASSFAEAVRNSEDTRSNTLSLKIESQPLDLNQQP